MIEALVWLYFKVMGVVFLAVFLWGWLFPAMISADDWGFMALGLIGLIASIPVIGGIGYSVLQEAKYVYRKFKENK